MPQVQFTLPQRYNPSKVVKGMPTPKRITELYKGWYKGAMTAIPQVPHIQEFKGVLPDKDGLLWKLATEPWVDQNYIRFDLQNTLGERAYLVIDRKASSLQR